MAAGDESALGVLYERTSARLFGLVRSLLRDAGAAEEALAETYAQAWRLAGSYDASRGAPFSWLAMLARTRAIDLRRARAAREPELGELAPALLEAAAPDDDGPVEQTQRSERACLVRSALESLPESQAHAIRAAFFGGLSHVEVAHALGEPLGTVKTRIRSGLSGLRVALERLRKESA